MDRRHLLRRFLTLPDPPTEPPGDLSPYIPRDQKPWDTCRAAHLLRRTGFGVTQKQIGAALASTPVDLVDAMLSTTDQLPDLPFPWAATLPFDESVSDEVKSQYYGVWLRDLQLWWLQMMLDPAVGLREKMTLFWHGHFVSEFPKVEATQHMARQNQLFRRFAFGDFRELTRQVTVDPAMLIYLDGAGSIAESPNENYARELMELFTLGVGSYSDGTPHYTENDVVEMARALTGWDVVGLEHRFDPEYFDSDAKTLFGETANFGVIELAERDAIDLLFRQVDRDHGVKRAAIHICTSLYQHFVLTRPDMAIVAGMAKTLVEHHWQIGPVLRELFTSEHFFSDEIIGGMIKSPVDLVIGTMNSLGLKLTSNPDPGDPESHDPLRAMTYLSQSIFYPPNVKGWPGGQSWISTATLPLRLRYTKLWIDPPDLPTTADYHFQPVEFIRSIPQSDDVQKVLTGCIDLLIAVPLGDRVRSGLLETLLGGAPPYEWDPETFVGRIRAFLTQLTGLPEYHLI